MAVGIQCLEHYQGKSHESSGTSTIVSLERSIGIICSGKLVGVGLHVVDFKRFILRSFRSSLAFFTNTTLG